MSRFFLPVLLCAPLMLPAQAPTPAAPSSAPATAPTAPTAPPALTSEQTANIIKQLEQLEAQIGKGRNEILGTALAKFRAGLAGPKETLGLYLDCYKLEHYDRRDLKTTDFQAWKEGNEDRLKEEEFMTGLMLQLEYLVMTIQAQDVKDQKEMGGLVTALQAYLPKAIAAVQSTMKHTSSGAVELKDSKGGGNGGGGRPGPGGGGGGGGRGQGGPGGGGRNGGGFTGGGALGNTLRQSVKNCEFSAAYLLESHLKRQEWAYTPLEIAEIYQQVIFPYYLEIKPTELPAQWDARINAELALRKITLSESEYSVYFKERQPELAWQKASYLYSHQINALQAMADMLKIIRENPTHPDALTWLKNLRQAVDQSQPGRPLSPGSTGAFSPDLPPPPAQGL